MGGFIAVMSEGMQCALKLRFAGDRVLHTAVLFGL